MGVKVYYAEISGHKEVKKHQQRVMMILDSKQIAYEAVDITEAGKESDKDFMLKNAKPRGDAKTIFSPQIFYDEVYCGDYEDFDLANENDVLEEFLHTEKVAGQNGLNGVKTSASAEKVNSAANAAAVHETNDDPALKDKEDSLPAESLEEPSNAGDADAESADTPIPAHQSKALPVPEPAESTTVDESE